MAVEVRKFIAAAEAIAAEEPKYVSGGSGQDGGCDCIGLIIGAIRRCGGRWTGIHGSNYAARWEMDGGLKKITSAADLRIGEVVYKAYSPGASGYSLPDKYIKRTEYYTGDLNDYYHVGIVESVTPLRIRHMTTPRPKMDTTLGKWAYHGKLKKVGLEKEEVQEMETVIIRGGDASAGIRMRSAPSTSASEVTKIPQGSKAVMLHDDGTWCQVTYAGASGYVMKKFVQAAQGVPKDAMDQLVQLAKEVKNKADQLELLAREISGNKE